jgi:hypothetical protein
MKLEPRFNVDAGRPAELGQMDAAPADEGALMRAEGRALLDAADEAISRALSRDSSQFLAQNRQTGGE